MPEHPRTRSDADVHGRRQTPRRAGEPAAALAHRGLLCIGDAAHAMSPLGGVGINLAIQDAVAAATLLAEPLRERRLAMSTWQRSDDAGCCRLW